MALKFFDNMIGTVIDASPDQMYRDLQQEYVNLQWDNTTQIVTVKEEEDIGSDVYNDLDVWIGPTVADTSTGLKFLALLYSNIYDKILLIAGKSLELFYYNIKMKDA